MDYLGGGIVGDKCYGVREGEGERMMLHAWKIGLPKIGREDLEWFKSGEGFEVFEAP